MARRWWRRRAVWIPALVLLLLAGAAALVVGPNLPAVRFLRRLGEPEPTPEEFRGASRSWRFVGNALESVSLAGFHVRGERDARFVLAHGVTRDGVEDARLWRLALSFECAGFGVAAAQLEVLRGLGDDPHANGLRGDAYAKAVQAVVEDLERCEGRRCGLVGISVGGAIALEAAARSPGKARAILLVGAPDDVRPHVRGWFRTGPAPEGAAKEVVARADAAEFARLILLRSALENRVQPDPEDRDEPARRDLKALRAWTLPAQGFRLPAPPAGLETEAGRRFAAAAAAGAGISDEDLAWVLGGATRALEAMSPASFDALLDAVRVPVFLVHGADDPLIPRGEMDRLAARLRRRTTVHTLESRLLEHVGINSPGLAEVWRHVRFLQACFDEVEGKGGE